MKKWLCVFILFSPAALALSKVDLQFAVHGHEEEILEALSLRRRDVIERAVSLFDTQNLDLFEMRIQIRLRFEDGGAELGVKRWGFAEDEFDRLSALFDNQCETDVHGDHHIRSCAVKKMISLKKAKALVEGEENLLKVFTRDQIRLLFEGGSPPLVILEETKALGMISSRAWEWHEEDGSKFSIDIQTLPDGQRFTELSLKTRTTDVVQRRESLKAHLIGKGLVLSPDQGGRRPQKLSGLLSCANLLKP